jgi:hypothetical protein
MQISFKYKSLKIYSCSFYEAISLFDLHVVGSLQVLVGAH